MTAGRRVLVLEPVGAGGHDHGVGRLLVHVRLADDLHQLVRTVGLEAQLAVEPSRQTGVDGEELVDLLLIARADEAEVEPMHLEGHQ